MNNPQPLSSRLYTSSSEIPPYDKDDAFWEAISNPALKIANNIALIETARLSNPTLLTDEQCRSQLAKLYVYACNMDFARAFMEMQKEKEKQSSNPGSDPDYFSK